MSDERVATIICINDSRSGSCPTLEDCAMEGTCLDAVKKSPNHIQRAFDPVNHAKHYTAHPSNVECITITRHFNFNRGNAIKYIWRAGEKGSEIQDLEKAAWYIADEIKRLKDQPR